MQREETPAEGAAVFTAGDPGFAFLVVGFGAFGCFVPLFVLDSEVDFGRVFVKVAFKGFGFVVSNSDWFGG